MIQLPDDVKNCGYKKTAPFCFEQVFSSVLCSFKGTEQDFVDAGFTYKYRQLDKFRRI